MPNIVDLKFGLEGDQEFALKAFDPQTTIIAASRGSFSSTGIRATEAKTYVSHVLNVDMTKANEDGNELYTGQGRFLVAGSEFNDVFHPNKFAPGHGDHLNQDLNNEESSRKWLEKRLFGTEEKISDSAVNYIGQLFSRGFEGSGRIEANGGHDIVHQASGGFAFDGGEGTDTLKADTFNYNGNNQGAAEMQIFKLPEDSLVEGYIVTWGKSGGFGTVAETEDFIVLSNTEYVHVNTPDGLFLVDLERLDGSVVINRDANGNHTGVEVVQNADGTFVFHELQATHIDPTPLVPEVPTPPIQPPTPIPTPNPPLCPDSGCNDPSTSMIEGIRDKMQMALANIPEGASAQAAKDIAGCSKGVELS